MKLLIDECVDERLRLFFHDHDCQTARFAKLVGLKNGRLLEAAEAGPTNRLRDLAPLVTQAIPALSSIEPGQVVRIQ